MSDCRVAGAQPVAADVVQPQPIPRALGELSENVQLTRFFPSLRARAGLDPGPRLSRAAAGYPPPAVITKLLVDLLIGGCRRRKWSTPIEAARFAGEQAPGRGNARLDRKTLARGWPTARPRAGRASSWASNHSTHGMDTTRARKTTLGGQLLAGLER